MRWLSKDNVSTSRPPVERGRQHVESRRERKMSMRATAAGRSSPATRWIQLVLGIICMASVANLQYAWTLFVLPIQHQFGWTKAEIQVAFTIFILCETWLVPIEGWIVDRIGPRWMILAGGIGTFVAWFIDANATQLWHFYVAGGLAGFAGGAVYGTSVGNALKWFPDKRGLCGGLTAAGFGAGVAITVAPIRAMIQSSGYAHTFLVFAIILGAIVIICSNFIRARRKCRRWRRSRRGKAARICRRRRRCARRSSGQCTPCSSWSPRAG